MATVVAAIVAGVLAGTFALLGIRYGSGREHAQWRREARRKAYTEFSTAVLTFQTRMHVRDMVEERASAVIAALPAEHQPAARAKLQPGAPVSISAIAEDFQSMITILYGAFEAVQIVGPPSVASAARKVKDLVTSEGGFTTAEADAEYLRLVHKVLGTG